MILAGSLKNVIMVLEVGWRDVAKMLEDVDRIFAKSCQSVVKILTGSLQNLCSMFEICWKDVGRMLEGCWYGFDKCCQDL